MIVLPDFIAIRLRLALSLHRAENGALRGLLAASDSAMLLDRGIGLMERGRTMEALTAFETALALCPGNATLWARRAYALQRLGRFADAEGSCDRALALDAGHINARLVRGVARYFLRRFPEALADFGAVLQAQPDDAGVRYNAGLIHLAMGDYATGWTEYETRWIKSDLPIFAQPAWRGESGGTVLLWGEQGLGDTLQFCRYAPLVARRANTILQVPKSLVRLLSDIPGIAATIAEGDAKPPHDWQCSLMSLPLLFQTTTDTIPADIPYLRADPGLVGRWTERLSERPGLRVGLVWAGNARMADAAAHAIDRRRSVPPALFAPLARVAGVALVSLQKNATEKLPPDMEICDWTDELGDFSDTAALIAALDLVICVDTSVAHLAGAMGKPVWILNRFDACWRWLDGRDDSPWYPTARLFRQIVPGDWANVIERVETALRAAVNAANPTP